MLKSIYVRKINSVLLAVRSALADVDTNELVSVCKEYEQASVAMRSVLVNTQLELEAINSITLNPDVPVIINTLISELVGMAKDPTYEEQGKELKD